MSSATGTKNMFARLFLGMFVVTVIAPSGALAQSPSAAGARVTRGDFLVATVKAYNLKGSNGAILPFKGVSEAQKEAIGIAHAHGTITPVFGADPELIRMITRGEALQVLQALTGESGKPTALSFRDVRKGTANEKAVTLALEKGWMTPDSRNFFGVTKLMTRKDVTLLLQKAVKNSDAKIIKTTQPTEKGTPKKIRIRFNATPVKKQELPNEEILKSVWKEINENFLYIDKVKEQDISTGVAETMVKGLQDPYSTYMKPSQAKNFQAQIAGEVTGIGAQVEDKGGVVTILSPLRGSPAEKAGLQPGDEILGAGDTVFKGMGFEDAVDKVRGPKGTSVKLLIRRNGKEFWVTVMRDTVKVPQVAVTWQGKVAVVQLMLFGTVTDTQLRPLIEDIAKENPTGVILDLRNNPGGLLHAAGIVVGIFTPKGTPYAKIKTRKGEFLEKTEKTPIIAETVPLVVLVNGGSASASEIVAGVLGEMDRATIIGTKTFGKGTVQGLVDFADGSSLKLTIAEWFTPKGTKIDGVGVMPDIIVEAGERDEQMRRAIETLSR